MTNRMTNEMIARYEARGFKRWTLESKGYDRLYVDATAVGLYVERYKTGNICYAEWQGEKISNGLAREMLNGKIYVDVNTGELVTTDAMSWVVKAVQEIIDTINAEAETESADAQETAEYGVCDS